MKIASTRVFLFMILMLMALPSLADVVLDHGVRSLTVRAEEPSFNQWSDYASFNGQGAWEQSIQLEEGAYLVGAMQNTTIQEEGGGVVISGSMENAMVFPVMPPIAILGSTARASVKFHAEEPFVILMDGNVESSGEDCIEMILYQGPNGLDPIMTFSFGPGQFGLELGEYDAGSDYTLSLDSFLSGVNIEAGDLSCVSDFELRILPASAVATEKTTWDKLRTLYR